MRRTMIAAVAAVAALSVAAPAQAATGGWHPVPSSPFDQAAGVTCDFPIHGEPVVDEVVELIVDTYADGSTKTALYKGDLVIRLTNKDTGAATDVDASGSSLVRYFQDGSMTWYAKGPVMVGFRADAGTLPRGQWRIDGVYRIAFDPQFNKKLTMVKGTTENVCERID